MPRGNGTGPAGMGSMTGRAAGYCAGGNALGFINPAGVRGLGCGRGNRGGLGRGLGGFGRGFRNQFLATGKPGWARTSAGTAPDVDEKQVLTAQALALQSQIDEIQKRLTEI